MFLIHFLFALSVTLILGILLALGLRRKSWRELVPFLIVIFLFSWAGGVLLEPFGPGLWGGFFLPFLVAGIFMLLLLGMTLLYPQPGSTVHFETREEHEAARSRPRSPWTIFFWSLVLALILVITARYLAQIARSV